MISLSRLSGGLDAVVYTGGRVRCSVGVERKPICMRVSRVYSLGKVDDLYELFYLADGDVFLLFDGKTLSVRRYVQK